MDQIIAIRNTEIGRSVNARDLHAFLGIEKDFTNWIKAQVARGSFLAKTDYVVFTQKGEKGGRPLNEYALTIDMAKHIAMMSGSAKGRQVRDYFIECEKKVEGRQVADPRLGALIESLYRIDAVEQEQARQAEELAAVHEKIAVIEARQQPEARFFTVMGYANLKGVSIDYRTAATLGRRCASLSRERGLMIGDVTDPRFGSVHTYHEEVLSEVI